MTEHHPKIPFERYADDSVCHGVSLAEAERLKRVLGKRLPDCRLESHPRKTKVVYCQDDDRRQAYACIRFDYVMLWVSAEAFEESVGQVLHEG
jgi:RNA-directed DNA polymerase